MPRFYVKYLISFCFLSMFLVTKGHSQNVGLVLQVADELYENKNYFGSIKFYEKALRIDSSNAEVLYKYGRNLSLINNHKKASRYLLKAFILDRGKSYPNLNYELAEAYRSSGEYRKARKYYNQALRPYRSDKTSYWYKRISQSKNAAYWASKQSSTSSSTPNNLGTVVNSKFSEFASTISNGNVFFSAMIADTVYENNRIGDDHFYSRLYQKSLTDRKKAEEIKVNAQYKRIIEHKHLANPSFYQDHIYFSLCDTNYQCEIWKGKLVNSELTQLKKLNNNINDGRSNNTQAHLAEVNGDLFLFFASDRDKGFGGLDIYKAKKVSFGFDEPINLGSTINSPDNEITPFFDERNQTLYFSSNWHEGYGGYDIFKSKYEDGKPFGAPENLGKDINSHYNDYYFQAYDKVATLTSNRKDGNIENSSSCCNDLFEVNYKIIPEKAPPIPVDTIVNEEILNKYLPLTLYFHNDTPDPNSKDTTTNTNYLQIAEEYVTLENTYKKNYIPEVPKKDQETAKEQLTNFFEEDLQEGLQDLIDFTPLLLKELEKGNQVVLTIRGFASSLSESTYNIKLTKRRIQSLVNYFLEAENGSFKSYIDQSSKNGGSLSFTRLPYGEFAVKNKIDESNLISAIYSPSAIQERKIELLAISSSAQNSVLNVQKNAKIELNSDNYDLGKVKQGSKINRFFQIRNTGEGTLKIYNVSSNLEQLKIDFPETLSPEEDGKIELSFNTDQLLGKIKIELLIVTNIPEGLRRLSVELEVVE